MSDRTFKVIGWTAVALFFALFLLFVILMGNCQAEEANLGPRVMYVTGDHVRERAEPSTESRVTGHYDSGDQVEVISITDGWALLRNGHYVFAQYLTDVLESIPVTANSEMIVIAPGARERTSTSTRDSSNVVCTHKAGDVVSVTGPAENGWFRLQNGNYIAEELVSMNYDDIFTHCFEQYKDIVIVSISRQMAIYYHYGVTFSGNVVTGHSTKSPTPTGLQKVTQRRDDFDMQGNPKYHVDYAVFFLGNIALHDADGWRHGEYGGNIYIRHGSNGCVNCEYSLIEAIYRYSRVDSTYVLVIP